MVFTLKANLKLKYRFPEQIYRPRGLVQNGFTSVNKVFSFFKFLSLRKKNCSGTYLVGKSAKRLLIISRNLDSIWPYNASPLFPLPRLNILFLHEVHNANGDDRFRNERFKANTKMDKTKDKKGGILICYREK